MNRKTKHKVIGSKMDTLEVNTPIGVGTLAPTVEIIGARAPIDTSRTNSHMADMIMTKIRIEITIAIGDQVPIDKTNIKDHIDITILMQIEGETTKDIGAKAPIDITITSREDLMTGM